MPSILNKLLGVAEKEEGPLTASLAERLGPNAYSSLSEDAIAAQAQKAADAKAAGAASTDFQLVGSPQSTDFQTIGEPVGGNIQKYTPPEEPMQLPATTIQTPPNAKPDIETTSRAIPDESGLDPSKLDPNKWSEAIRNMTPAQLAAITGAGGAAAYGMSKLGGSSGSNMSQSPIGTSTTIGQPPSPPTAEVPPSAPEPTPAPNAPISNKEINESTPQIVAPPQKMQDIDFGKNSGIGSDENLKAAQSQQNNQILAAQMGQAGNQIAAGILKTDVPKSPVYDEMIKSANLPVEQLQARIENEKNDPDSSVSQGYRDLMKRFGVNIKGNPTAAALEKAAPWLEKVYVAQEAQKSRAFEAQQNRLLRESLVKAQIQAKEDIADKRDTQHQNDKQAMAKNQTMQLLESARGNPEVSQALKDRYSASKAKALIAQNYDLNNLSNQQVNLLVSEVGKIAMGGVPTHAEFGALSPNTLSSQFSGLYSKVANHPTPANAAAFIKQYDKYLTDLNSNAQRVIHDKWGRVIESKKDELGDKGYSDLKNQYINPAETQQADITKQLYTPDVIKYAQDHNISPEAALKIKIQRTGGK